MRVATDPPIRMSAPCIHLWAIPAPWADGPHNPSVWECRRCGVTRIATDPAGLVLDCHRCGRPTGGPHHCCWSCAYGDQEVGR